MLPPSRELLLEAVGEALQTMAFICPELPTSTVPEPATSECLSIRWFGSDSGGGHLQLATPRSFGELLAVNILALEPGTPEVARRAMDALLELCNIVTGGLLVRLSQSPDDALEMGLPQTSVLSDADAWRHFVSLPQTTVLLADGYPLAIRAQESHL
jgi:hypothetical protein